MDKVFLLSSFLILNFCSPLFAQQKRDTIVYEHAILSYTRSFGNSLDIYYSNGKIEDYKKFANISGIYGTWILDSAGVQVIFSAISYLESKGYELVSSYAFAEHWVVIQHMFRRRKE
jgi:hypothetical protein